jgi:hypothetical protein
MIERAVGRAQQSPRRDAETRWPGDVEHRRVESLGVEMPVDLAAKFERHLMSKTTAGRRTLTAEAEVSL